MSFLALAISMSTVRVNLGPRSYDIAIDQGDLGRFARERAAKSALAVVISDANVEKHARAAGSALKNAGFQVELATVPAGEASKCLAQAERLYDRLADLNADRKTMIVAFGGGVVGDLAGFVAATYNRGLPLLMIPTTLLAMVDSSVGGKVGINHAKGKNLIGAFHQPHGVWIDTAMLATLPEREFRSGLAEVVKYGVILDADFFSWQEQNADAILRRDPKAIGQVVERCCKLKAGVVEQDEREETGLRAVLNYGHTFAHAFETAGGYGSWLHGEAVAAGMVLAAALSVRAAGLSMAESARVRSLIQRAGLPVRGPALEAQRYFWLMARDKKVEGGRLRFVLLEALGHGLLRGDVSTTDIVRVLAEQGP